MNVLQGDMMTDAEQESKDKAAYAALLLQHNDPFKAALALFPDNTNRALRIANEWVNDPEVKAEQSRLRNDGADLEFLPGKAELAQAIWNRMQGTTYSNGVTVPCDPDDYAKLAKLYADVRGFIDKPQTNVNVNNVIQRVIEVPVYGSTEEWEAAAAQQQRDLLNNARTRH